LAVFPEGEAAYFSKLLKITYRYPTPVDILKSHGLVHVKDLDTEDRQALLKLAAKTVGIPGEDYRWLIRDLSLQRVEVMRKIKILTRIMENQVKSHPYGHILLSFPHLGTVTAATLIGIINEISRWPDKRKLKKALGVYSRLNQSGGSPGYGRLGKSGSRHGRRVLFLICLGCIRSRSRNNDFRDYYLRQVSRGKPRKKALVSTMGKLTEIIFHCLKTGEPYVYQGIYRIVVMADRKQK
jgi:transposase